MQMVSADDKSVDALKEKLSSKLESDLYEEASEHLDVLRSENVRLKQQVRWLEGKPYRSKAETVAEGQLAFDLLQAASARLSEDSTTAEDAEGTEDDKPTSDKPKKKRKRRGRDLLRQIVASRLDKDDSDRQCECCAKPKAEIGFDTQERFFHQPATVTIIEERFYKYACSRCQDGVQTCEAQLPPKPIPGSMASASMLAFLAISKVLDGLPIERVAKQLGRFDVDLSTSTLNDWFGRTAGFFVAIQERLREDLLRSQLISLDDTPLSALNRKHAKNIQKGRQWLYIGDKSRVIYCAFTEDWKGSHPRKVLEGFAGDVQGDGYAGINPLFTGAGAPRRVGCNDHARRKFVKALEQGDTRAQEALDLYRVLYAIERKAREKNYDVAQTLALRKQESVPIWDKLERVVSALKTNAGKKSPLGKAVTYFTRQLPTLRVFLDDGFLPIANTHVERQIRTVALFRKNSLFVGSLEAGDRYATLLTVMLNCLLVGANPYNYIADVISKVASGWPLQRLDELLPRQWHTAQVAAKAAAEEQAASDAD